MRLSGERKRLVGTRALDDLVQLSGLDLFELFLPAFELFKCFDHRLGHALVGVLGTAHKDEFLAGGDAFVAVLVVEADAKDPANLGPAAAP